MVHVLRSAHLGYSQHLAQVINLITILPEVPRGSFLPESKLPITANAPSQEEPKVLYAILQTVEKLSRKLVHISVGLVFMLFWPLSSSGSQAPYLAALAPGIDIIRMILLGLGIWKKDALFKSMSRSGDYRIFSGRKLQAQLHFLAKYRIDFLCLRISIFLCLRELLKGPLYYALTLTIATAVFWRISPVSITWADDIVGRLFGHQKLPYNRNKSISGSIPMASAGFLEDLCSPPRGGHRVGFHQGDERPSMQ
ncbi:probable phytol kinase 2, chloroplastic [Aristolochia californica]|uniref:probable phytol kinase 2, chloroplastic n=1 Tax=Aristolochia californica TaxID=171875 RepID=UPI0035E1440A